MKIRDLVILAALAMPYAIEPLIGVPSYATDLCCSESQECPGGYVCRAPNVGEECSPDSPGYCGLLVGGGN
jgi:hypothetical protein